jgi:hypothetical protein
LVALVVGVGAVAGCGSSSSSSAASKLTKAQFLTQANAICRAGNAKTNAIGQSLGANPSRAKVVAAVEKRFVPAIQAQITEIRALAVQTADKNQLTSILNLAQADLNKLKADPTLIANTKLFADFAAQGHPYGLTECAKDA